jgi:hypothetical protein
MCRRRLELIVNLALVYAPLAGGLLFLTALHARTTHPLSALACIVLCVIGAFLLLLAKVSLFRRCIWVSWGPAQMSRSGRRLYAIGYSLIGVGVAFCLLPIL